MELNTGHQYRLRVASCLGTIIDVHRRIRHLYENLEFLSQFEKLKEAVDDMDMSVVTERDVVMVEQATNDLLGEFRPIFETGAYDLLDDYIKH